MFKNVFRIRVKGLNIDRLFSYIQQNFKVYNVLRLGYDELLFEMPYNNYYNLLSKIDTSCYNITIEKTFGVKKVLNVLKRNLALVISIIICLSVVAFLNTRLLKISVYGASENTTKQIQKILNKKDITIFKSNNISLNNLERVLLENINEISLVSAVIKGNVLIINVKEKLPEIKLEYADFTAPYNLIIEEIECHQGTVLKKKGELVKRGESIVGAYVLQEGGGKLDVNPIFNIKAKTFVVGETKFEEIETKLVRTGKQFSNSCYNMFGRDFFKINKKNKFKLFEEKSSNLKLFENLFIPLTVKRNTFYELKEVEVKHDFEKEKDGCLKESLDVAKSKLLNTGKVVNTTQNIIDNGNQKIIQTYLEVELYLTND